MFYLQYLVVVIVSNDYHSFMAGRNVNLNNLSRNNLAIHNESLKITHTLPLLILQKDLQKDEHIQDYSTWHN